METPITQEPSIVENVEEQVEVTVVEEKAVEVKKEPAIKKEEVTEKKELRLVSTKNVPMYKIATRQRNMVIGTIVAGHSYPYKGKTHNAEGIFYNIGKGFVFAEDCVKIK